MSKRVRSMANMERRVRVRTCIKNKTRDRKQRRNAYDGDRLAGKERMPYEVAQPALCSAGGTPATRAASKRGIPPGGTLVGPPRAARRVPLDERG